MAEHKRDIVPRWLLGEYVHRNLCQSHLVQVGIYSQGWHRHGALYSNFVDSFSRSYKNPCGCEVYDCQYFVGCIKTTMNSEVATKLFWIAINVLHDAPPLVPCRGEPVVHPPLSKRWERALLRSTQRRHREKRLRNEEWSEEDNFYWQSVPSDSEEDDEEESSEEERIT